VVRALKAQEGGVEGVNMSANKLYVGAFWRRQVKTWYGIGLWAGMFGMTCILNNGKTGNEAGGLILQLSAGVADGQEKQRKEEVRGMAWYSAMCGRGMEKRNVMKRDWAWRVKACLWHV